MINSPNRAYDQSELVGSIIAQSFLKILLNLLYFYRSGVFASFGLSGIIPAIHYGLMEGWFNKISQASLGWLILMGKRMFNDERNHNNTSKHAMLCFDVPDILFPF